jgi:hypothetical protein
MSTRSVGTQLGGGCWARGQNPNLEVGAPEGFASRGARGLWSSAPYGGAANAQPDRAAPSLPFSRGHKHDASEPPA